MQGISSLKSDVGKTENWPHIMKERIVPEIALAYRENRQ